jgi:hypothetical protein
MMRRLLLVRVLVLIAWTTGTAVATAQDVAPTLGFAPANQVPVVVGNTAAPEAPCQCEGNSQGNSEEKSRCRELRDGIQRGLEACTRPFVNCLNRKGLDCCSTHDECGCTSLFAHCTFIFGSCRQFMFQPCVPPPAGRPCGGAFGCGEGRNPR